MDLEHLRVPKDLLQKVDTYRDHNNVIVSYYERLMQESPPVLQNTLSNVTENLRECNRLWFIDFYQKQKVKDFQKTNTCKDKFCSNCKKVKQASRMARFENEIFKQLDNYDYASQMVLTVPNVPGVELEETIKNMTKAYAKLNRMFRNEKVHTPKWVMELLGELDYHGAIRTLEVTYKNDEYHPHFHVLLIHNNWMGEKKHVNQYSFDKYKKRELRKFTDFEIVIQKLWRMLIEGQRMGKKNYDALEVGYSCMVDPCQEGDYLELFKYMVKTSTEDSKFMQYHQFKTLYFALKHVRQIQGYGIFHNFNDDTEELMNLADQIYDIVKNKLNEEEVPVSVWQTVKELLKDDDDEYLLISRKQIFKHLRKSYDSEKSIPDITVLEKPLI